MTDQNRRADAERKVASLAAQWQRDCQYAGWKIAERTGQ